MFQIFYLFLFRKGEEGTDKMGGVCHDNLEMVAIYN